MSRTALPEGDETARRLSHAILWLFGLNAFAFLLAAAVRSVGASSLAYWLFGGLTVAACVTIVLLSGFPVGFYGLVLRNVRQSILHAFASVVALSSAGLAGLAVYQALGDLPISLPLFETRLDPELLAYVVVSAPLQEFVFRGVFQSSARFILGPRRGAAALAIAFSTVAYAASHLPWGLTTALFMVLPGLVWGWQFEKDRSLLGVILAHVVIGYLFVAAMPLWTVMTR